MLIFTPIWGRFPFWRAYFSNELKPPTSQDIKRFCMSPSWMEEISPRLQICVPETFAGTHRWDFNKTIIRIPMFHNQFLKANFWPPKKNALQKNEAAGGWYVFDWAQVQQLPGTLLTTGCHAFNRWLFLGWEKKNDIWWQISSFQEKIIQGLHSGIFFHVMFVQCFFPKKKIGWSTSSFTRRLVHKDVCWWSFIRGDGDVDSFFPLTFWWFWGASRTRRFKSSSQKKYCP